jgi:uncharacterized delta-60 repeat protein
MKILKISLTRWMLLFITCSLQTTIPVMVLDESFGIGGIVTTDTELNGNCPALIQPTGKIIISTFNGLVRFNQDGSADTIFNHRHIGFNLTQSNIVSLTLQGNDIISTVANDPLHPEPLFYRYNSNGVFQRELMGPLSPLYDIAKITFQPDGKFILNGAQRYELPENPPSFVRIRYNADGTQHYEHVGRSNFSSLLIRYNADGTVDETFNHSPREGNTILTITVQSNGKIIAGIRSSLTGSSHLASYNPDGSLERDFGVSLLPYHINSALLLPKSILLQANHKIIVQSSQPITRYNTNGTLDTSFGTQGTGSLFFPEEWVASIALKPDGKIIVLSTSLNNPHNPKLSCYNENGSPDVTFGPEGTHSILLPEGVYWSILPISFDPLTETIIVGSVFKYLSDRHDHPPYSTLIRYRQLTPEEIEQRRLADLVLQEETRVAQETARLAADIKALMQIEVMEECSICAEEVAIQDLEETPCGHLFHPACLQTWTTPNPAERARGLIPNRTCPMCRADLFPPH